MAVVGKKARFAKLIMSHWTERFFALRNRRHLSILAYHSVQDEVDHYPFNSEIISAYTDIFEQQLLFINKYFNVINFHDLVAYTGGVNDQATLSKKLPPNSLIITFDDGYADNATRVMPMLKNADMTAVVYVSTDYIDQQNLFWFDEVAYLMRHLPEGKLELAQGRFKVVLGADDRESQRRAFGRFLQSLTDAVRLEVLDEFRKKADISIDPEKFHFAAPLTWDQIRDLRKGGIEIGSHTKSHGFLDVMTDAELVEQVSGSKARIEKELGEKIVSFSYPNGNLHEGVTQVVMDAGYSFAVCYDHAIAHLHAVNPLVLPRIHVETDVCMALFKSNLLLPEIFVR